MNVGRDERVRPADALGPMAALPTSTLQTVMPANHSVGPVPTRWVSSACLSCISWSPFLSPRRAIDCITHAEPPKELLRCLCSHLDLRRRLLCRPVVAIHFWAASFSDATNVSRTPPEAEVFMGSPTVA